MNPQQSVGLTTSDGTITEIRLEVRVEGVPAFFVFVTVTDKNLVPRHFVSSRRSSKLVTNPLHIFEENLLAATVIQFGGPTVGMVGDSLSGFQGAGRSAASVRTSGRRDNLPVFTKAAGNKETRAPSLSRLL